MEQSEIKCIHHYFHYQHEMQNLLKVYSVSISPQFEIRKWPMHEKWMWTNLIC